MEDCAVRLKRGRGVQKFTLAKTSKHHALFVGTALRNDFTMSTRTSAWLRSNRSLRAIQPGFVIHHNAPALPTGMCNLGWGAIAAPLSPLP